MADQDTMMTFDPATGERKPYPSHATQWRHYNGSTAWLFNPWTGHRRTAQDVGTDTFGYLVRPPGEVLVAHETVASPQERPCSRCKKPIRSNDAKLMEAAVAYCSSDCAMD